MSNATDLAPDEIQLFPHRAARPKPKRAGSVADLSFVADLQKTSKKSPPRTFWSVKATGDYARDCATGERLAREYLDYARSNPDRPPLLPWIVGDMPRDLTGIETAFLSIIAESLS